jgi:hypothetical protein
MKKRSRYLTSMGVPEGPGIAAGDVLDVDVDEADRLIERDMAEEFNGEPEGAGKGEADVPAEPFAGYADAHADEVIDKIEGGELGLTELLLLVAAEKDGKDRSTVVAAAEERLRRAAEAAGKPPVEVPDDVVPGETPGWPVDAVTGEVLDLPEQVREELAAIPIDQEVEMSETRGGATADGASTESARAAKADTTASRKAATSSTKTSRKAAAAKKRS